MSKQTNAFQQLIHYIYERMEGKNATVTESALLLEQGIDEEIGREVDVLIERNVGGKMARIAVECRDRANKDDIQWVDCLIGKYLNLEVDKVIAVSNSGYSKAAQLKALANGIELTTLNDALEIDFYNEFTKIGMATIQQEFKIQQVVFECIPALTSRPTPEMKVISGNGEASSLDALVSFCFKEATEKRLAKHLNVNFLDVYKTRADLEKTVLVEHKIPLKEIVIESSDGELHQLLSLTLIITGKPTVREVAIRHRTFEEALVTEGVIDFDDQEQVHTIYTAQIPEASEGRFFVKSKPKRQKQS